MSLDVYLETPSTCPHCNGEIGPARDVFWQNITHNLNRMADAAGLYYVCWRPRLLDLSKRELVENLERDQQWADARALEEAIPWPQAKELIEPLRRGIADMKARPDHYQQFNAPNGWGLYEHLVPWLERYLAACEEHPNAFVRASR